MKNYDLNKRIGDELRTQRIRKRMTLEQVATGMGLASRNTVSYMELGKKSIDVESLISYCDVVGCDWKEILYRATGELPYARLQG
jgi:transcriptional regulator with XRE-family HTH domain